MKRVLILSLVLLAAVLVYTPRAHAQLVGGDPLNNFVCPADMDATACAAAGYGGTGSGSGGTGGLRVTCRSDGTPETKCYGQSYSEGRLQPVCYRQDVSTGWCVCVRGKLSGSCTAYNH